MRKRALMILMLAATLGSGMASAAGRYTMLPAEDGGFIRLDTETGATAHCRSADGTWDCRPIGNQESALATENNQLRAENEKLKAELKQLEGFVFPPDRKDGKDPAQPNFQLPSEEDVDKALTYLQRIIKKFKDKMEQLEKETTRKPPGPSTPL